MTNFFNKPHPIDTKRNSAMNYVKIWLRGRPYLDKQLIAALYVLLPELREEKAVDDMDEDYEDM